MPQRIYIVDAFSNGPFTGNPAAVCPLGNPRPAPWMQGVAMEMNQAETAFFWPTGADAYALRWFTPVCEVALCGHATLAAAHMLFAEGEASPIAFQTESSGTLTCTKTEDGAIAMDFPSDPPTPCDPPKGIADALGVQPLWSGVTSFDWLFELAYEDQLRSLSPDMTKIAALGRRGVIVTTLPSPCPREGEGVGGGGSAPAPGPDFLSRFFAPQSGVPEDPVTGSAHCALGPFWMKRLGKNPLQAWQCSARGGGMQVDVAGGRIKLTGQAATVLQTDLSAAIRKTPL